MKWRKVLLLDPCVYCFHNAARSIDHIHPTSKGGADNWENQAPACRSCNSIKGDGSLLWMLWRRAERRMNRYRRRVVGRRVVKGVQIESTMLEYDGMLRRPEALQ